MSLPPTNDIKRKKMRQTFARHFVAFAFSCVISTRPENLSPSVLEQSQCSQRTAERLTVLLLECSSLIQMSFSHTARTLLRLNGILAASK